MGFKAWRNLGVLALAGASLVGCTSGTQQKVTNPPQQNNPWNTAQPNPPPPNPNVFGAQQPGTPSANGGLNGPQRPNTPGFPQTSGMPNQTAPYSPANQSFGGPSTSTGGSYQTPSVPIPSTSANANNYLTTPNPGLQQSGIPQSSLNPGLQPTSGNGAGMSPNAFQPVSAAPGGVPSLPTSPPLAPGGFTPPSPPLGFGTSR